MDKFRIPSYTIGAFLSEPENPASFAITRFDNMEDPDVDEVHRHEFYEILWVSSGHSRQTIDFKDYEIKSGDLFFISPGQVHAFEEWQQLQGGSVFFTRQFVLMDPHEEDYLFGLSFLDNLYSNPIVKLPANRFQLVEGIIGMLEEESSRGAVNHALLRALLKSLLVIIQEGASTEDARLHRSIVLFKRFCQFIEAHLHRAPKPSDLASLMHVTPHHLNVVCKEVAGKTSTQVIRDRFILEAKRLLAYSDMTVSQVGAELGFFDPAYFSRVFSKEVDCSPMEFRSAMSEKSM